MGIFSDTPRTRRLYPYRLLTLLLYSSKIGHTKDGFLEINPARILAHEGILRKTLKESIEMLEELGFLKVHRRAFGKWTVELSEPLNTNRNQKQL